jgi:hypothetical protein
MQRKRSRVVLRSQIKIFEIQAISEAPWNHLDDKVDLDQYVVSKELSRLLVLEQERFKTSKKTSKYWQDLRRFGAGAFKDVLLEKHHALRAFEVMVDSQVQPFTLHPTPYIRYPTPYFLHPTPYTFHPTLYILHLTPYTLHPTLYTLHPTPPILPTTFSSISTMPFAPSRSWSTHRSYSTPYTLHHTPYTLHPTLYTLHPTPCTLHQLGPLHLRLYTLNHYP